MTKRLSDRQAEVDQWYVQMEHHRAHADGYAGRGGGV